MASASHPDPAARALSHLLVGLAAAAVLARQAGLAGGVLGGLLTVAAHEALDAPLAGVLAEIGV